jgi:hypothetical protein
MSDSFNSVPDDSDGGNSPQPRCSVIDEIAMGAPVTLVEATVHLVSFIVGLVELFETRAEDDSLKVGNRLFKYDILPALEQLGSFFT